MGINGLSYSQAMDTLKPTLQDKPTEQVQRGTLFSELMDTGAKKAPYSYLAKDGIVEYNGVTFVCDYKKNALCLGDVSNPKDILNIPLPSGGCLKVNKDNIGDLQRAVGMFSPADLNAIMRAIAQYNHCTSKLNEIDEEEEETIESATDEKANKTEEDGQAPDKYKDMSAYEILAMKGEYGNPIPTVNQVVTAKNPEDGQIYLTYFTDGKITCEDGNGKKVWDMEISESQHDKVEAYFQNYESWDYADEIYSGDEMGKASVKDFWISMFSQE